MEKQRLTRSNLFFIGSMLFGMFFGAGNLIFPVFLGQASGKNVIPALIGFLISGVGLPLLGVAAIGLSRTDGVFALAQKVGRPYAFFFTIILYLCMGPLFATPRLATISYEIGLSTFIPADHAKLALLIFSFCFFLVAWLLARRPGRIMTYVGKVLTPAFLVALALLLAFAIIFPLGHFSQDMVSGAYRHAPLIKGFTNGYMTMDALASLAFGVVVVNAIRDLGVTKPKAIATDTIKAGGIAALLMAILYAALAFMGLTSLGQFDFASNGGVIIAEISNYYFGTLGSILTAIIVILACLKTGIGLLTSFGDTAVELFPRLHYRTVVFWSALVSLIIANVGLNAILAISEPVMYFLYPLAIVLILTALAEHLFDNDRVVYVMTTVFTFIPALLDGLNALPTGLKGAWVHQVVGWGQYLPGFSLGLGWVCPALLGFVIGLVAHGYRRHRLIMKS
ncbi:branched-chain amino acid transport system II carrier protein [Lacticaseibacillus thailandensis]|uniref:Branched-chain amino acid transport system carrier protein n=1 Tax=Lacticaseibacillus thailandensis DSM 22698 = JCM 13996 TaxID=1423810 RepID=A0A0R2C4C6_9LACO|nr:branched-chain amino acid transport system II carrier protein [Lacticaseibacillus thailandensis]KRM86573.1 branched-chain amino acid transport protein [Lacticaseibacillus thailandensis DSM 22698 = JCM 13996]